MMDFKRLVRDRGWFSESGENSDVVNSSRVRLARSLIDHPFPGHMSSEEESRVQGEVVSAFRALPEKENFTILNMKDVAPLDRRILLERNIITQDFSIAEDKAVILNDSGSVAILINEVDHVRIAGLAGGMNLDRVYAEVESLEALLERQLHFAISLQWGYLNSSLTDIGTGLRASYMVHLPALVMAGLIDKALKAITQVGLLVKGFFGEGISSLGNMYQISNQVCIGASEQEIIDNLRSIVTPLVGYERKARQELLAKRGYELEDRIFRAWGILTGCRMISSKEAIDLLSDLRLGVSLGVVPDVSLETTGVLFFLSQKSHVQKVYENGHGAAEDMPIDVMRARMIRETLANEQTVGGR